MNEIPTSSYITGLLYPADTDVTEDENYNDVEFTEKNFNADGETLEGGVFEEEEPEDRVKGGFQKPSSIGVSFYVSDDVQKVNAYINWGKYYAEQVQGEVIDETLEEDAENKKKKKHIIYIREQMNDVVEIDFNEMGRSKQIPLESNGNIYIEQGNWNYYTMYISRVIHGVMQEMGYSEEQIGQYFKMSGDTTVTKTHGRKSVGGINRMVMDAQYFGKKLEKEAKYQWELSEYLNRDICQPEGFDAYGYPSELFKLDMERLGIAAKRKPAKVIDFVQYIENNRGTNN